MSKSKDSNPKDNIGSRKAPITTVSFPVMAELGLAMMEGALKYGKHNYREIGVRASVYLDAMLNRHFGPWAEGEDIDPDSGLSHLVKGMACAMIVRDAQIRGKLKDDRPRGTVGYIPYLNAKAAEIVARYGADAKAPFTAVHEVGGKIERTPPDIYVP